MDDIKQKYSLGYQVKFKSQIWQCKLGWSGLLLKTRVILEMHLIMSQKRISDSVQLNGHDCRGVSFSSVSIKGTKLAEADLSSVSFPSKMDEAHLHLHLKMLGDLIKSERLCMVCESGVFMSNLHPESSMRWKIWSSCAGVYLLWLLHHQRGKHSSVTHCQRRLTHLSIMTFEMILTFRLSQVYQYHCRADIYLLLLLYEQLQAVCSLRCVDLDIGLYDKQTQAEQL